MGLLDSFRKKEDPAEKTFHDILQKKEDTARRQSYAEGRLEGIRIHERERGRQSVSSPQSGGFFGGAGKILDGLTGGPVDEKRMRRIIHGPD